MSAGDHMAMGGFLVLLGSWLLGTAVALVLCFAMPVPSAFLIGGILAAAIALAGTVEFIVGMIGAGVKVGLRR